MSWVIKPRSRDREDCRTVKLLLEEARKAHNKIYHPKFISLPSLKQKQEPWDFWSVIKGRGDGPRLMGSMHRRDWEEGQPLPWSSARAPAATAAPCRTRALRLLEQHFVPHQLFTRHAPPAAGHSTGKGGCTSNDSENPLPYTARINNTVNISHYHSFKLGWVFVLTCKNSPWSPLLSPLWNDEPFNLKNKTPEVLVSTQPAPVSGTLCQK